MIVIKVKLKQNTNKIFTVNVFFEHKWIFLKRKLYGIFATSYCYSLILYIQFIFLTVGATETQSSGEQIFLSFQKCIILYISTSKILKRYEVWLKSRGPPQTSTSNPTLITQRGRWHCSWHCCHEWIRIGVVLFYNSYKKYTADY